MSKNMVVKNWQMVIAGYLTSGRNMSPDVLIQSEKMTNDRNKVGLVVPKTHNNRSLCCGVLGREVRPFKLGGDLDALIKEAK